MNVEACKQRILDVVVEPMLTGIHEYELDNYTEDDVAAVRALLESYVDALADMNDPTDAQIMEQVKSVVLALNEMNEATDYEMIETEEREMLWEIIQKSAEDCGLNDAPNDVTEEWREW